MSIVLDLYDLEQYVIDGISFRGDQIKTWCIENLKSSDDNVKYAANEIYRNYFLENSRKALKSNKYYYIIYGNAFIVGHLYTIVKDNILSPKPQDMEIRMKTILDLIDRIDRDIYFLKNKTNIFDDEIDSSYNLMKSRLKRLGIRSKKGVKHSFYPANNYKKYQIYNIINTCALDIKAYKYMMRKITE